MDQNQNPNPTPRSHKWTIIIVVFLVVVYFIFSSLSYIMPVIFSDRSEKKSNEALDKITEMIKPAGEREYQFHSPSKEVLSRKIDCKNLGMFQDKLPVINPLCLNLYKTTPEEINKKLAENENEFDRVILYGEKIIWDAPIMKKEEGKQNYGKILIDTAKFNDQITIPTMMKLYGFSNLDFVNKPLPGKALPFSALYFRLSHDEEVQKACKKTDSNGGQIAGCALGMWSSIIPSQILGENMSLANQKVWRLSEEKNKPYVAYDYKWPINCFTDSIMIHETAHLFLNAYRVYNISDTLVTSKYFNEHQADTVKIMATNMVCGEGVVTNFRDNNKKEISLVQFNAAYPPGKMGSVWPEKNETCKMGILNEWNRFLAKGNFDSQFTIFSDALKGWMEEGKTISDDRGMANFLVKLNNDSETKKNLQYRGCYF